MNSTAELAKVLIESSERKMEIGDKNEKYRFFKKKKCVEEQNQGADINVDSSDVEINIEDSDDTISGESAEGFIENIDDRVFFCDTCKKHFLATKDTPDDMISCPVCDEDASVVELYVSTDMEESDTEEYEDSEDLDMMNLDDRDEMEEIDIDEVSIEDSLNRFLKGTYTNKFSRNRVKIESAKFKKNRNRIVFEGNSGGRRFSLIFRNADKFLKQGGRLCEVRMSLFPGKKIYSNIRVSGKSVRVEKFF